MNRNTEHFASASPYRPYGPGSGHPTCRGSLQPCSAVQPTKCTKNSDFRSRAATLSSDCYFWTYFKIVVAVLLLLSSLRTPTQLHDGLTKFDTSLLNGLRRCRLPDPDTCKYQFESCSHAPTVLYCKTEFPLQSHLLKGSKPSQTILFMILLQKGY